MTEEIKEILNEMIDEINKEELLKEFQSLSSQVEQRLEMIENTERQLDRWRDQQLQKNRIFWDGQFSFFPFVDFFSSLKEYRRQVENYSSSRIRSLQYEYTNNQILVKRLKFAKYLSENLDRYSEELIDPSIVDYLSSEQFLEEYQCSLSNSHLNKQLFERLSCLDQFDLTCFE